MTPNDAWRYCENIPPRRTRKGPGRRLSIRLLTIDEFRRKGMDPESMDWAALAGELKTALAMAGHPAGRA